MFKRFGNAAPSYGALTVTPTGLLVPSRVAPATPVANEPAPGVTRVSPVMTFTLSEDCEFGRQGETIQLAVSPSDTADQSRELETYLGGYTAPEFGADLFSNINLVDREAGVRRDFSLTNLYQIREDRVGRQGAINEIEHSTETTTYETSEHALAAYIPWASENDAVGLYDVKSAHSDMIAHSLLLNREKRIFDALTTTSNWNSANYSALATTYRWDTDSGTSTADPLKDFQLRINASLAPITRFGMNPWVAYWFLKNADVQARMRLVMGDNTPKPDAMLQGDQEGVQTLRVNGIPPIVVVPSMYFDSSGAKQYCLGNGVIGVHNPPSAMPRDGKRMATHMTFRHRGRSGTGWQVNEYMPNGRGVNGGVMYEAGFGDAEFFGSNRCGGLISNVLATPSPT